MEQISKGDGFLTKIANSVGLFGVTAFVVATFNFTWEAWFHSPNYNYVYLSFLLSICFGLVLTFYWTRKLKLGLHSYLWTAGVMGIAMGILISSLMFVDHSPYDKQRHADSSRIAYIEVMQKALKSFYDENNSYPKELSELSQKYLKVPTDIRFINFPKPYFYYSVHISNVGKFDSYHLGVNLEYINKDTTTGTSLNLIPFSDKDCNSITGLNCSYSAGYDKSSAFDGSDDKGCGGERGKLCYDVTP